MFSLKDVVGDIEKGGMKVGDFFATFFRFTNAIQKMWSKCGAKTLIAISQIAYDTIKVATLAAEEAGAAKTGDWKGVVQLSPQTTEAVKQLVADFKAGDAQVRADFAELRYDFAKPAA